MLTPPENGPDRVVHKIGKLPTIDVAKMQLHYNYIYLWAAVVLV
jgi:hypothetical protein